MTKCFCPYFILTCPILRVNLVHFHVYLFIYLLWDQLNIFGHMNTCFSKCVLQLQLEGCNQKTCKITIMRPLSALMKTYQTPNMHLQNVIVFFYQKMKTKRLLTLCEFFLISKRGQGQVILDPTLPHPTVLHTKNSCYSCSYNLFAKKKKLTFFFG